jgi:enhancing lycopene biosynthesis protein 2
MIRAKIMFILPRDGHTYHEYKGETFADIAHQADGLAHKHHWRWQVIGLDMDGEGMIVEHNVLEELGRIASGEIHDDTRERAADLGLSLGTFYINKKKIEELSE